MFFPNVLTLHFLLETAIVMPFSALLCIISFPSSPAASIAERSHTLSTPVHSSTKSEDTKQPCTPLSSSAVYVRNGTRCEPDHLISPSSFFLRSIDISIIISDTSSPSSRSFLSIKAAISLYDFPLLHPIPIIYSLGFNFSDPHESSERSLEMTI